MRRNTVTLTACVLAALSLVATAETVTIPTVPVGNPGNTGEWSGRSYWVDGYGRDRICGAVNYGYYIGKYEVTAGQYCEFLNAVTATDTHRLYDTRMWSEQFGCKIQRSDSPGGYVYSVAADRANRPVNYVNFWDACRFANWLHNGQPTGAQDLTTTEDGAYFLDGVTSPITIIRREADWKWAVTSEDEWYKAAYHKNDGVTGNYWDYATCTDSVPSNDLINPDPGNNANAYDAGYTIGHPYYRTEVGEFENSEGPYGTFDQAGNLWEWNEAIVGSALCRGLRGGGFGYSKPALHASYRGYGDPSHEDDYCGGIGFRVSRMPEPGDADGDGDVDFADYQALEINFGSAGATWRMGDFDRDGDVDFEDYQVLETNFGWVGGLQTRYVAFGASGGQAVPEPTCLALLLAGALVRRRKPLGA